MNIEKERLGLNQFSERTYDFLRIHFPEILDYVTSEKSDSGDIFLKIEKQSPNSNANYGLYFSSDDEEFTVGFDCYHCHFFRFAEQDFDTELENAVRMIKGILNNEVFILKFINGDKYLGSQLIENRELDSLDKIVDEWNLKNNEQGKIVSWDGQFDQDVKRKNESPTIHKSNSGDSLNMKVGESKNLWQKLKGMWS